MAYRKLDHIDEKIVDAALRLGGSVWPDAGFATHDIAVRCGVSETVIFKHFQTKEKLLAFARAKASVTLNHSAEMIAEKTTDLSIFAHEFFAYLVAHSQLTYFILNYGSEIPHGEGTGENFSLENQESLANPPSFLGGKRLGGGDPIPERGLGLFFASPPLPGRLVDQTRARWRID